MGLTYASPIIYYTDDIFGNGQNKSIETLGTNTNA